MVDNVSILAYTPVVQIYRRERMSKVTKYGKPISTRFLKQIENEINAYAITHEINRSDVITAAVTCFLKHPDCKARKDQQHNSSSK